MDVLLISNDRLPDLSDGRDPVYAFFYPTSRVKTALHSSATVRMQAALKPGLLV